MRQNLSDVEKEYLRGLLQLRLKMVGQLGFAGYSSLTDVDRRIVWDQLQGDLDFVEAQRNSSPKSLI